MKAVITVIGHDKVGIIARVSALLSESNVNILDITQTIMQDIFTMIMLVNLQNATVSLAELVETANALGEEIGVKIILQHEEIFNAMYRV